MSRLIPASLLAFACLTSLAACQEDGAAPSAASESSAPAASAQTAPAPASTSGGAISVTLTGMEESDYMGLPACQILVSVNNATSEAVRSLTLSYRPEVEGPDRSAAEAGGDMTLYIREIAARSVTEDDTKVRGARCASLRGLDVSQIICQTEARQPCSAPISLSSAITTVPVRQSGGAQ